MKQYEAVVKVMEQNGGYATLTQLYEHVLDVPGCYANLVRARVHELKLGLRQ
jgi:hypothetical protein